MAKNKNLATDIIDVVREGTKRWTRTIKAEERSPSSRSYRSVRMTREKTTGFKEAAAEFMEQAYLKASDNGKLPANARQIMYAARPHIQAATGRPLDAPYFTQTLLPDFMREHDVDWDVVYDARGHFNEPHNGRRFGLGHLEVRQYIESLREPSIIDTGFSQASVKTIGPSGNYNGVLFIEKEGFDELIKQTKIPERFDLAYMSTKGMSVTAARELADNICHDYDIPLLPLHDFDKTGFSIKATVSRDTRRYEFKNKIRTIDLGLTLADVKAEALAFEHQFHAKGDKSMFIENLRKNGATEEEIDFMFQDFDRLRSTRRVELNAMTSPQFIAFLERKLREHGFTKIIPEQDLLAETYVAMERGRRLEIEAKKIEKINMKGFKAPGNLNRLVAEELKKNPGIRWDAAIQALVRRKGGGR
jgi:DNA topoisomerase 6 subunit A-like protein